MSSKEILHSIENIGIALRSKRKSEGLTQGELGKKLNISGDYISKIEIGYRNIEDAHALVKEAIAKYLYSTEENNSVDAASVYEVSKIIEAITPDQAELLQEWERLTDEERNLIKGVIKSMKGKKE